MDRKMETSLKLFVQKARVMSRPNLLKHIMNIIVVHYIPAAIFFS